MEIELTSLLDLRAFDLSHSQMEGGPNAGPQSWDAAKEQADETALLDTPEKLEAFRDWVRPSGGWDKEEIDAWGDQECNALFLQWVAGDVRQCPATLENVSFEEYRPGEWWYDVLDESGNDNEEFGPFATRSEAYRNHTGGQGHAAESLDEIDWQEYEVQASKGHISSNLFRADDGTVYFSLCH